MGSSLPGLGKRIALLFVRMLGKSSLGLSYGMAITDPVLAPATPSNTARAGGVIYPIIRSLAEVNGSTNETPRETPQARLLSAHDRGAGQYHHRRNVVTAMAGNPLAQNLLKKRTASGLGHLGTCRVSPRPDCPCYYALVYLEGIPADYQAHP